MAQLQAEITRRRNAIPALTRRAADLRKQLASVELELKALDSLRTPTATTAPSAELRRVAKATSGKRGRKGKGGGPTLGARIVETVSASTEPVRLRDLVSRLSKSMGRDASKSFLVQVSSTIRRLVDAKLVAQVDRGLYKSV